MLSRSVWRASSFSRASSLSRAASTTSSSARPAISALPVNPNQLSAPPTGLYDPANERENCGVGFVAHMKGEPSRKNVTQGLTMLARMVHRGGCGCEINTGDGAGALVGMPDGFFRTAVKDELGVELPAPGQYGVGMFFLGQDTSQAEVSRQIVERVAGEGGIELMGWRTVPTDNSMVGPTALSTEPMIEQAFFRRLSPVVGEGASEAELELESASFERALFALQRRVSNWAETTRLSDFYVCSLSSKTVTYKGQLTSEQVHDYYHDLQQDNFESHFAMVHSRFSTNTFPSWARAQPNRILCHNGEINTLRGNKNWMRSREAHIDR